MKIDFHRINVGEDEKEIKKGIFVMKNDCLEGSNHNQRNAQPKATTQRITIRKEEK
jgi:hypothetical protein